MRTKDEQKLNMEYTEIKSKVKFTKDMKECISKALDNLADYLDKNLETEYEVDWVDIDKNTIKIKVNDENKFIFRTINCTVD